MPEATKPRIFVMPTTKTQTREAFLKDKIEQMQTELEVLRREQSMDKVIKQLIQVNYMYDQTIDLTRELIAHADKSVELQSRVMKTMETTSFGDMCDRCPSELTWGETLENHCPMAVVCSVYERNSSIDEWSGMDLKCLEKWNKKS